LYSSGLTFLPVGEWAVVWLVLHADTVEHELVLAPELLVLVALVLGEAPLVRDVDLLSAWELELGTTERLNDLSLVLVASAHANNRLTDVDTCDGTEWLAKSATHTGLQTIGACARQHLVDAQHVERMHAHADVERVLTAVLHQVLVGADTRGPERLRRQLLVLVRDQVHAERELVDACLLAAQIKYADLGIWDTSAMS